MAKHNELGKAGEEAAKEYLICKGYTIRETNWRCNSLEIDLVVQKDGGVIFVEVKTRTTDDIDPTMAITETKVRNIIKAGKAYLAMYKIPQLSMQIDIIFVIGTPGNFKITHMEDAVQPRLFSLHRRRK